MGRSRHSIIPVPVDTLLPLISKKNAKGDIKENAIVINNVKVNLGKKRYHIFARDKAQCVDCGIHGMFFAIEQYRKQQTKKFHLNLYAMKDGKEILMNVDHIIPKSKGGTDDLTNLQTMCEPCNLKKGNSINPIFMKTKVKVYKVGGAIRDELLGVKPKDIDYAIEAESYDVMKEYILEQGGKIFLETPQYFTIRAQVPELGAADFVLCRKDGQYKDNRRPESVEVGTIYDDLARRDFTVNAIAQNITTGEIIDPYCGKKDLGRMMLTCVGSPTKRFEEDALRMIRAIRFMVTKGFHVMPYSTLNDALHSPILIERLRTISAERIKDELERCFKHDTIGTLITLNKYEYLRNVIFTMNEGLLWLQPTMKQK